MALSVAGWACRKRGGLLGFTIWLLPVLVVTWLLVFGPFAAFALISSGGRIPWLQLMAVVPGAVAITLGVLLPFLVLSFANRFYRERLKALLHLGGAVVPPVVKFPTPSVAAKVGS